MTEFYNISELKQTENRLRSKYSFFLVAVVAAIAVYLLSFLLHSFLVTFLAGSIGVCACILFYYSFVSPVRNESQLIRNILSGKSETEQLNFLEITQPVLREGVACNKLLMQGIDAKGRTFERELYIETTKSLPMLTRGEQVEVSTYQGIITTIKRI